MACSPKLLSGLSVIGLLVAVVRKQVVLEGALTVDSNIVMTAVAYVEI